MGDRTTVTLAVPTMQLDEALAILAQYDSEPDGTEEYAGYIELEFTEVNYGDLRAEMHLTAAGIAWQKIHGSGSEYNAGRAWAMFREDGALVTFTTTEEDPEETLSRFFDLINEPEALVEALKIEQAKFTPPSWENQEEYGKRYLTRQLLTPA